MHLGWGRTEMGGASAHLSTEEFVADMIGGVTGLSLGDTSRFLAQDGWVRSGDVYEGEGSLRQSE